MRKYLFADESGDIVFKRDGRASKYFTICTVCIESCKIGADLLELRRKLAWEGYELGDYFHACEDKQVVRDQVFNLLKKESFSVQATIMEKSKAQSQVRTSKERFYQYGWLYLAKHGIAKLVKPDTEILITTASMGTKKGQAQFTAGVNDVFQQIIPRGQWRTFFCSSASDPCLQVVDYCSWAIHKKWERGDTRSYDLIKDKITYEYDLWKRGTTHHY